MSATILKYRIPGESVVEQKGLFKVVPDKELDKFTGFVVGDFQLQHIYGFFPGLKDEEVREFLSAPVEMDKEQYTRIATEYIEKMKEGEMDKIILSRVQSQKMTDSPNVIFNSLCEAYPKAFVYYVSSPLFGTWIGATPERLVRVRNKEAMVVALAGTKLSMDNSPWRQKEIGEQAYVTDFLEKQLTLEGVRNLVLKGPGELTAGPVKHLYTELTFDGDVDVWKIIKSIHPTPAVCGIPQDLTKQIIVEFEPHQRGLYTGIIGLLEKDKVELFVNLRCGQIIDNEFFMYLGGGLTKYSVPEEEWEETLNKAKTLSTFL